MPSGIRSHWSCAICRSNVKQRSCCGLKSCEHSLFAQKTIEQMHEHNIRVHGWKKPDDWDVLERSKKNKAKAMRKKNKKQKRRK